MANPDRKVGGALGKARVALAQRTPGLAAGVRRASAPPYGFEMANGLMVGGRPIVGFCRPPLNCWTRSAA